MISDIDLLILFDKETIQTLKYVKNISSSIGGK